MEKGLSSHKDKRKNERLAEVARKKKMRIGMLIVGGLIVAALIALAIYQANQPKKGFAFDYASLPTVGQANAPIKLVEFGDYKCSHCQDFASRIYPELKRDFIDTGKVQLSFMNFQFLAGSLPIALATQSVYHQNKDAFWTYYDEIFKTPVTQETTTSTDYLVNLAKTANIPVDYELLKKDIDEATYADKIRKEYSAGSRAKVTGTPAVFANGFVIPYETIMNYALLKPYLEKELQLIQ